MFSISLFQPVRTHSRARSRPEKLIHRFLELLRPALGRGGFGIAATEFLAFGLKQAYACLFGGLLLGYILLTRYVYPEDALLSRYDFLFLCALGTQIIMIATRLETPDEARIILIFHVVGTVMEIFKTSAGSWIYPEDSLLRLGGVPLFTGFMYASVGSYLARVARVFDFAYSGYPPLWTTWLFALAIYVNFFSHHFIVDLRICLFGVLFLLFGRTQVHYTVFRYRHRMPLVLGFFLVALFIWIAENIGTFARAWQYPGQSDGWTIVSFAKLNAWVLLMIVSFVLVTLVNQPKKEGAAALQ
ncbi:DUF817 domain-containing protein [Labrenzia sp. VG12]|uniref:DUF817 domain-containing protein n=1 Tax=Labrenzia sp. VG12 TaxID=2021862 RepID=UPI000B8BF533|nr:DUF817 domain-containing protein [Labrenzia sp. VG12]ASP36019.1 hypothetical protein CHH27_24500 [Labrenzia sp. VG12]